MSDPKNLLRDLHNLHLRDRDLRVEAEEGPKKLRRFQAKIDLQQKQLSDHQDALKHLKVTMHEKEVSIKDNLQKVTRHQQQMNEATSKKEYDALRHEIDNEKQANRVLEDEILELMVQVDEQTKQVPVLEKSVQQAKEDYRKEEERIGGARSTLEQRLGEARAELKKAEEALTPEARSVYVRLVQQRGHDALAPVAGQSCSGCYTDVTPQNRQDLRVGRTVVCKSCGRLLYLAE